MNNDYFSTSDIGEITALYSLGFKLSSIGPVSDTRAEFVFERREGLDDALRDYSAGKLCLEVSLVLRNYNYLRERARNACRYFNQDYEGF